MKVQVWLDVKFLCRSFTINSAEGSLFPEMHEDKKIVFAPYVHITLTKNETKK